MARTINSGLGGRARRKRVKKVLTPHVPIFLPSADVSIGEEVIGSFICPMECDVGSLIVYIEECPMKKENRPHLKVRVTSKSEEDLTPSSEVVMELHRGLNKIDFNATLYEADLVTFIVSAATDDGVKGVCTSLTVIPSKLVRVEGTGVANL